MSEAKEKAAGQKAARSLRNALRKEVNSTFQRRTGLMAKPSVSAKSKFGLLDRITIGQPHYSFIQHFGWTRKYKSKSVTVAGKEHLSKAIDNSGALERLADELGEIRVDNVVSKIRF